MRSKATIVSLGIVLLATLSVVAVRSVFAAAPVFTPNQVMTIPENSANGTKTTPAKPAVVDPDGGHPLNYAVVGGTGDTAFDIGFTSGEISVIDSAQLDHEATPSFTLQIVVTTTVGPVETTQGEVTINVTDVSDIAPVMDDQVFNVNENAPANTTVGTIVVTDGDASDTFTFQVTGGDGDPKFSVDNAGVIKVKPAANLDYESKTSYTLTVKVIDNGGNEDDAVMTININPVNEPPIVNDQTFNIDENVPNGTVVGTVVATDPENDTKFFEIVGVAPFSINDTTGQITVADSSQIDYEANAQHKLTFTVRVRDATLNDTAIITVNLNDVNDKPKSSGMPDVVVNESAPPKLVNLWTYWSDDEDPDASLTFTLQGNTNNSLVTSAVVNNVNGTLTLTFAAGAGGTSDITIRATDTEGAFEDDTFKVDVNDAPTTSGITDVSVNEDAPNTEINLYNAFADAEDPDQDLTYDVVGNSNAGLFNSVSKALPNLVLDYAPDANGISFITVRATDTGGLFVETTFKVTVIAVNDKPQTSGINNVNVSEDAPNSNINLNNSFSDAEDADSELTYQVMGNTNPGLFDDVSINIGTGTLVLDYKANAFGSSTLTVRATDTGNEWVETSFTVNVAAVNDKPTVGDFSKNTDEDIPVDFALADFAAEFEDVDGDSLVAIRIETLPGDGDLELDGAAVTTGQVIAAANISKLSFIPAENWDEGNTDFDWNGTDGTAYADDDGTVTINVGPVNDIPTVTNFTRTIDEDTTLTYAPGDFAAAFVDVDGDTLTKIRVLSLPANGVLQLNGVNVAAQDQINFGNLGQLTFKPNQDWFGNTSFSWNGHDGSLYATTPALAQITVNPQNDKPIIDLNGQANGINYDAVYPVDGDPIEITSADLFITDIDNTELSGATVIFVKGKAGSDMLAADELDTDINVTTGANGNLILEGPDTVENYERVLRTVTFMTTDTSTTQRQISFRVDDGLVNSADAYAFVDIINPKIAITVEPPIQTVIKNNTAVFSIAVQNTGDVALTNVKTASQAVADCTEEFLVGNTQQPATLAPGEFWNFACSVSNVTGRIDNVVVASGEDVRIGSEVMAEDNGRVRVVQDIAIDIVFDPQVGNTLAAGETASFLVTIINPGDATLKEVVVSAFTEDIVTVARAADEQVPAPSCDFEVGTLNPNGQQQYECSIENVQNAFEIEVVAAGLIEGLPTSPTEDFDIEQINLAKLGVEAFADPFEVQAGQNTTIEFNVSLTNMGNVSLTLSALTSDIHGNLLNAGNGNVQNNTCATIDPVLGDGVSRSCSYEVSGIFQAPGFSNMFTGTAAHTPSGKSVTQSDDVLVSVATFSPVDIVVSANPETLVAPGGSTSLSIQIINNQSSDVTVDSLVEAGMGNLDGKGDCEIPQTIDGQGSYSCSFVVDISGQQVGDAINFEVTAGADGGFTSDTATVLITERPIVRFLLPNIANGAVAGEPNNRACDSVAVMPNSNYYYMPDDEHDWYHFHLSQQAQVTVRLTNYMASGQLVAYSGNCLSPTFIQNNGNFETVKEMALGVLEPGTYFLWVLTDGDYSSTTPYTLRVDTIAP